MDQSKTIIRFSRDKNIEASRANAILALDNFLNIVGQPVIVRYYRDEAKTKIDMILAVGIQNGKGRETYSIIYAGSPDAIIFGVSRVPGLYPDVSLLAHGELYIVKDTDGDYCYCYAINDRRYIEKITGGPYRYLNITDLSNWTFDGGELRKDNSYEKGTENDLVTGTDEESKVWDAKTISEFVNSSLINATKFKGGFDASTGTIDGTQDTLTIVEEKIGDVYTVTTPGTFAGKVLEIGDSIIFRRNVAAGTEVVEDDIILVQSTVNVINKNATLEWQTSKTIATIEGTDITVSLPANPNTDTKVTSVDNHYTPVINPASEVDATLVGEAGSYAKDTEYTVLTGVSAQGDAKGHITGMTYTAQKIKDTNTTYTFSDGTEGVGKFKVKSSDSDTAQEVTVSGMDSKQNKVPKLGSSTKPIYTSSEGTFAEGSTYAGGTKVTLNGSDKGAKDASIYAPESAGTEGQFLSANASGNPVWVANPNTDTKVTAVDNHYEPVADGSKEITATITGSAGSYAKDTEYTVLTGVKAQRDAKGHVTGLTYTAQKIKDTNTEYTKGSYSEIVSGTGTTGKLWDAKSIHDYVGAGAAQLIISNPFISIPTDENGVVLNDFSQEITLGLYVNDHTITTSDVQITENPPRYVTWKESLTAFPASGITVSAPTVNTPGTASASNNNLNLVNIDGLYVVPTTIRIQVSQGTTLTDKGVDILAYGYDENGRLYNGSGVLFIQQHQYWLERPQFTSMVFKRATTKPNTPNGGTYDNPIPVGWSDGIPSGTGGIVWATTCVFYGDGTKSGWTEPQAQIDTDTLDIEFSPNETQPEDPDDDPALRPAQGWYDPSDLPVGEEMIWRAERKKKNGAYDGDWVVTRILGEKGADGRSITKSSADTYRYAVSSSGTVAPSSGWQTSRPTVPEGQYLWTETTLHWSDGTTTVLYGVERNPNDGVEGMSVVISSQSIDYCRRTAEQGQADPTTLTYSTYPSTLNQGDWLYTRTTVNYEDGDGNTYSTVSYSVSRIGEDGANGSGISAISEHYKANNSSTNPPPRTGDSDWDTDPMPSDWDMSKRYLWNYEKITKVDSAGNITYERTTPGVIAIYTEDGKGIDSIINYYVATSHSSGVTTDNPDDGEWTTTIQTTTEQKPYLWNYEIIYYIKEGQPAGSTTTDPHIIHNFATSPYFADIDNEMQSVACEVDGKPTSAKSMVINVSMWKGSNKLTLTNLTATLVTGENIGINREQSGGVYTGKITFTVSSSNAISEVNTISIRAYYGEIYRDLLFTINGVRGGKDAELYELVPSINDIAKRKDGSYVPSGDSNITCSVVKTKGDTVSTITPGTGTGVILKYSLNGGTETAYTGGIRVDTVTSNLKFILYKEGTNTVLDRETIPLVIDGIDGTSPYFADIDNEMQSVACDKNGYPTTAKTMNAIVTMWKGTNPLTLTTLTPTLVSGSGITATATPSSGVIAFTVSPSTAISDVNTFQINAAADGVSKTLYFTVNGVKPGPDGKPATLYELVPSINDIAKRKDGSYVPSGDSNITCSVVKTEGDAVSTITPGTGTGVILKYSLNGGTETAYTGGIRVDTVTSNLKFILYKEGTNTVLDRETIPLVTDGIDGTSPYFADLDNEMDSISCNTSGNPSSTQTVETNVSLWKGSLPITINSIRVFDTNESGAEYTSGTARNGIKVTWSASTGNVKCEFATTATISGKNVFCIKLTNTAEGYGGILYFTVNGVRPGAEGQPAIIYSLIPSTSSIKKDKNGSLFPSSPMTCDVRKVVGNATPTRATSSDGTLRYRIDGDITSSTDGTALTINTGNVIYTSSNSYIVFAFFVGTTMVDKERVPIVSDGSDGTSPYFLDIDNEMYSVACAGDGKPIASGSKTVNVKMWRGTEELTPNISCEAVSQSGVTNTVNQTNKTVTFAWVAGTVIEQNNSWIITAVADGVMLTTTFVLNGVRGGKDAELYELVPSINDIVKRKDGSYVPSGDSNITCSVVKTKGDIVSTITPGTGTGVILKYSLNGGTETAYPSGGIRVDTVTSNLKFILYKEGTNTVLDRETIPLVTDGIDGGSPIFADIDNEMQSVACNKNGYPTAAKTMNAIVTMWEGTNPLTLTSLTPTLVSGSGVTATATPSSGVIAFKVSPSTAISDVNTFQISVSANGISKTLYFTVNGVRPGPDGKPATLYELVPNTTEVVKRKDGSYSPSGNITCSVTKNQGGNQSTPAANEYVLKKSLNGGTEVTINTSDETAPSSIVSNLVYSLYDSTGTKLIDKETIPLIYDGNDSAQLVFSSPLISVPTDNEGVVLEDFTQEITARLMMSGQSLWLSNITVSESNPKYISWETKLNVFPTTGITVSVPKITVPNTSSVSGSKLNISSISQVYAIPTSLIVHVPKGATLSEKDIEVTAAGYDTAGNEYHGYGILRIQCQYWVEKAQFQSMVFKRSNSEPDTPEGGTYDNPIPEGWEDGIPEGVGIVWASVCTFYGDGTMSGWSKPQAQIDTDELDIEFSPSETQPSDPTGDPFTNRESQGWYDPMSPNFPTAGTMIWRAERKVKNGEWAVSESGEVSDWVVTRIYGEQGDTGADAINVVLSPFAVLFSQDVSSGDGTAAQAIAQITPETITSRVVVTKGETPITTGVVVSVASTSHFNASGVTIAGTTITLDKDGIQVYEESGKYYPYDNGYVDLNVAYNEKNYPLRLQFYVNVMGKFKTTIEGDVETSIANKTWYEYNPATGNYDKTTTMGEFIRSSSKNTSTLDEQVNNPTTGLEHKYSVISQNVNNISLKVGQYYNLFYNAFFGELLAERSPYNNYTGISLVNEGTYGGKAIRMGGNYFSDSIESSIMGSDTKGYGVYLDKGTYTFQMYARVSNDYSSYSSAFAGVQLLWDDNADFSTWSSSKILYGIKVTGTSYSRYTYTFTLSSARYVGFRMIIGGLSVGGSLAFFLYIDAVMLEIGSTASSMISSYGGYQSGADVGKVRNSLLATGIDIEKGKITMTADKFECQNNSGVKTAWLDDMGNFTIRGVYNNLITVINNSNWNKYIIKIGSGTLSKWYLDVLLCGTFVVIESLPSDVVSEFNAASDGMLHLPYYANNSYFTKGYTRYLDKSTSTPRLMTADELRMLAGRKMVIKWNAITGISNNRYLGYVFRPEVHYGNTTITTDRLNDRLRDLYAGERHCISINSTNISTINRSPAIYVSRTFFLSFNLVKFHANQSASDYSWGYIWMADDDSGAAAKDDINW